MHPARPDRLFVWRRFQLLPIQVREESSREKKEVVGRARSCESVTQLTYHTHDSRRRYVLQKDNGTPAMRLISDPIKEGAEGFLKVQYTAVARIASLVAVLIFASYYLRPSTDEVNGVALTGVQAMPNAYLGLLCALSFCVGACCSAAAEVKYCRKNKNCAFGGVIPRKAGVSITKYFKKTKNC